MFDDGYILLDPLIDDPVPISGQDYLTQYVHQQLCTSLCQLMLLDRYAVSGMEVFPIVSKTWSESGDYPVKLEKLWKAFNMQCESLNSTAYKEEATFKPTLVVSSLVRLVWKTIALELRKVDLTEHELVKNIVTKCTNSNNYVAGFDEARFNFLHKIANSRLSDL